MKPERASPVRGTAFQAVSGLAFQAKNHGLEARATEVAPFDPAAVDKRQGAYLPHWTQEEATYSVTFRLADSLPQSVLESWLRERDEIVQRAAIASRPLTDQEIHRLSDLHSGRVETYLDAGHGSCHMNDPRIAQLVRDALLYFDGDRYDMIVWCVMPNHVHVIVRPAQRALPAILHSWKSYTANEANKLLSLSGTFWQPEYFDHLLRDAEDLQRSVDYVLNNPIRAGLAAWPWSGWGLAFQAKIHGQDARATARSGW